VIVLSRPISSVTAKGHDLPPSLGSGLPLSLLGLAVFARQRSFPVKRAVSNTLGFNGHIFCTFLLAFVFALTTAASAVSFQPVSPDELKMSSEPKAPGAPAIILFREVNRDDRSRTAHEDVYFRIKILTEEGRK
jgi:hypothetical protein